MTLIDLLDQAADANRDAGPAASSDFEAGGVGSLRLEEGADDGVGGVPAGLRFLDRRERSRFFDWAQIDAGARTVAAGLQALGLERGERVALIYPTCPEFFFAFFGILRAGAVPVPLYPPVRLGRLDEYHRRTASMLRAAGASLVLTDGKVRTVLGETMAQARADLRCRTLNDLPRGTAVREVEVSSSDLALVQFSSGTTVDPKPVALSHRAVLAQVQALNSFWPDDETVRHTGVSWLPLYHDMGLIGCVFPALERPSVLTLLPPEAFILRPAVWLRAVSTYRATISVAPNFAYGLCVDKIRDEQLAGVDLSSWRVALNGAEQVAPEVLRAFQERFARWGFRAEALTPVYGLSEATLAVTFSDLHEPFRTERFDREALGRDRAVPAKKGRELASVGRPLPGLDLRIVAENAVAPEGCVGAVQVQAPWIMDGYLGRPEATAEALRDGWLDTGDRGFLWQGELFLTGRAKDVLILRGRNHAPQDVEQAVQDLPGVRAGCVVAVAHQPEGTDREQLVLFVERAKDAAPGDLEALRERAVETVLAVEQLEVDEVVVLEPGTLPRTSSGKLRRQETLTRWLEDRLDPPTKVGPGKMVGIWARSAWGFVRARRAGR
ncbi:MAG: fatty acyl-AMP ligase [Thermoanaerobaculia bacterium]|nr:fatty acyl-AMP ligase [Thermoanaerobaculia bacterium]